MTDPKPKNRSIASRRFGKQWPLLLLFLGLSIGAGNFLFREISADRFHLLSDSDPIYFEAGEASGLAFGSQLMCQGLTVGRVRVVKIAVDKDGREIIEELTIAGADHPTRRVRFDIEATLEKPYVHWVFRERPLIKKGISPAYLGLASIELELASIQPPDAKPEPQRLTLRVEETSKTGKLQDDVGLLMESLVRRSDQLALRIKSGDASSIEHTLWNLDQATAKLDSGMGQLVDGDQSALKKLTVVTDKLSTLVDDLGAQVKTLTATTTETVATSQKAITNLNATISNVEKGAMEVLGDSPAARRELHNEILGTLQNLKGATATLNDLLPRVGDTAVGRMIIKKKPPATPTPKKPAATPKRR